MLKTPRCPLVNLRLNYLDRDSRREILVNTKISTIKVDLVAGCLSINRTSEMIKATENFTYDATHTAMLLGNDHIGETTSEGIATMHLIAVIEEANKTQSWVTK